jgi:hypothetical protein
MSVEPIPILFIVPPILLLNTGLTAPLTPTFPSSTLKLLLLLNTLSVPSKLILAKPIPLQSKIALLLNVVATPVKLKIPSLNSQVV